MTPPPGKSDADAQLNRRFVEASKVLPLTRRVLAGRFDNYFRQYAAEHAPGEYKGHLADDLAFATYLEAKIRRERREARWVLDLVRYERARLKAADPSRRLVLAFFRHDIGSLVRSVARKEESAAVTLCPTAAVWWRPKRRGMVRYTMLPLPLVFRRAPARVKMGAPNTQPHTRKDKRL